jgi:hypothetical protein
VGVTRARTGHHLGFFQIGQNASTTIEERRAILRLVDPTRGAHQQVHAEPLARAVGLTQFGNGEPSAPGAFHG